MPGWPSWDVQTHLDLMDRHEIGRAMLSLSSPGVHFGDDLAARALAHEMNNDAAAIARKQPDRFGWFAVLPLPDVPGSLAEISHVFDELGADGVMVLINARGVYLCAC
jgi:6-methylsalicylate decarboxylase